MMVAVRRAIQMSLQHNQCKISKALTTNLLFFFSVVCCRAGGLTCSPLQFVVRRKFQRKVERNFATKARIQSLTRFVVPADVNMASGSKYNQPILVAICNDIVVVNSGNFRVWKFVCEFEILSASKFCTEFDGWKFSPQTFKISSRSLPTLASRRIADVDFGRSVGSCSEKQRNTSFLFFSSWPISTTAEVRQNSNFVHQVTTAHIFCPKVKPK